MIDLDQLGDGIGLSPEQQELLDHLLRERSLDAPAPEPAPAGPSLRQPVSFAQQRLWLLHQLDPGSAAYNMPAAARLRGRLDTGALARSLAEVVRRHEVLRTTFEAVAGRPVPVVAPAAPVALPVVDLRGLPGVCRRREIVRLAREEAGRPFDLARGPLLRCLLLVSTGADRVLLFTLHHIVADGWSIGLLVRELAALYAAFAAGRPSPLRELPLQYGDFARRQREWLQGEALESQLAYWRQQLAGAPASLDLPADRPRPAVPSLRGGRIALSLPPGLAARLQALGQEARATRFMTLLAGFQALLARWADAEDLVVGSPIANRHRAETEVLIGFFVNTLALRLELAGDPPVREILRRAREVTLGAYAHQDLPFEKLVEELRIERQTARSPLFQALFAFQGSQQPAADLPGLRLRLHEVDNGTAKFDLTLSLEESSGGALRGALVYDRDLFDPATAVRLSRSLRILLAAAVDDPGLRLSELPLLGERERHQLLCEWSRTDAVDLGCGSLHGELARQVARTPGALALIAPDGTLTYRELDERAGHLAGRLLALGVTRGQVVALCLERSAAVVVAMLAVLKAGGAYLPLDPALPAERLASLLAESAGTAPPTLLTVGRWRDRLAALVGAGGRLLVLDEQPGPAAEAAGRVAAEVGPDDLAYVLYTSGSTGRPKGVAVPHRGVLRLVRPSWWARLGPDEVFLQLTSLSFDVSTLELWGSLLNGGRLVIPPPHPLSLAEIGAALRTHGVTILWLGSGLFHQMVDAELGALASLRQLIAGGDVLQLNAVERVRRELPGVRLINGYGPTENTTFTCCWPAAGPPGSSVPIGRPIANTSVYVVDRRGREVPVGVPGELLAGGDGLARGYLGRPDLTADRFVPDPFGPPGARLYRTGDLVRYRGDGALEFLGRSDRQVKIRGIRVEPGEVEGALLEHGGVGQAAVLVLDGPGGRRLVAYVVGRDGRELAGPELREHLRRRLPDYMVPAEIVPLAELPLTPNGKLDRSALPAPSRRTGEEDAAAPGTPAEELLAGLFADLLGLPQVGPGDDFFLLGGHSLLATQAVSRVRELFGVELPLRAWFENPTPGGLAASIERLRGSGPAAPPVLPVPRDGSLPLSFAQQRLWFLDQLEPGSSLYNVPTAVRARGPLRPELLARALGEVVRRHEVLRTRFPGTAGRPVQAIDPAGRLDLPVVDLAALPGALGEAEGMRLIAEDARRPFDLARGPLARAFLARLATDEWVLALDLHHIVADGWSLGVLLAEVTRCYEAFLRGASSPLPELPVQYADFAVWQRAWLQGEVLEAQLGYWRERLAGPPAVLELPVDRPRPRVRSRRGGTVQLTLDAGLSAGLAGLCRRTGATLFMALLAGFEALLQRYCGQDEITVGSPVANRNRAEIEPLIGFFVNTLVLRTDLAGDPDVRTLLARVREVALGAYGHQDLPFEKLVEELAPERDPGRSPLFQVLFALQNAPLGELALPGISLSPVEVPREQAKFDLALSVAPAGPALAATLDYGADLFDRTWAGRLLAHLASLLAGMAEAPERRLSDLPLLGERERHQLLSEWSRTGTVDLGRGSIHGELERRVDRTPDTVALIAPGETLSYRDLDERANRLARRLLELGLSRGEVVALCLERSAALVVAMVAVLKAGGAYLPLDPALPAERLASLLAEAGEPVVATSGRWLDSLTAVLGAGGRLLVLDGAEPPSRDAGRPGCEVGPEDLAYVMYTSGSTGRPKGVAVPHRAVLRLVRPSWWARLGPEEVFLQLAPASFDASTLEIWGALLNGGRLVIPPPHPLSLAELGAALRSHGVTTLWLTAGLFHQMVEHELGALSSLRHLLAGGDVLQVGAVERVRRELPGLRLINGYGPTENTTFTCCWPAAGPVGESVPLGRPIANTEVYVVDRQGRPVPGGVAGELLAGGDGLARGYLGRPELTAERFVPAPFGAPGARLYRTGDLVRYRRDGTLEFLGRIDRQVKIRGFRVEPGEIEGVLLEHPAVRQAAVVVHDGPAGRRLLAYSVPREGRELAGPELRELLRRRLPDYMVPSEIVPLAELPLTANGKLDRAALPVPDRGPGEAELAAPATPTEELLAGLFADLLGLERVSRGDDFFLLGGHSLLATQAVSRLREAFGVELPLRTLFEEPTVAGLAAAVDRARAGAAGVPEAAIRILGPAERAAAPLSFAQERLWFLDRFEPGSAALDIPAVLRLRGSLDLAAFARSLDEVARRHEVLRTSFGEAGGIPFQRSGLGPAPTLEVCDLADLPDEVRQAELGRLTRAHVGHVFDLSAGPLLLAWLVRLSPEEHLFLLNAHHAIADGWSMAVLVREVEALYAAAKAGRPSPLPELPLQYADYAAWQRGQMTGEVLAAQLAYWRERLGGEPPALELPLDRPRPPVQTFRGVTLRARLDAGLAGDLRALARGEGATLFMALLAGFEALLARQSGETDVLVGTPVAGRTRVELEELIGCFLNTLVLRADLAGDPRVGELLGRVREVCLGAYAHQDLPFERLLEELAPRRDLSRTPLFQVFFNMLNLPSPDLELPGLAVEVESLQGVAAKFDLTLYAAERDGGIVLDLVYNEDLFGRERMAELLRQYELVLRQMAAAPERRIGELSLLTEEARRLLPDPRAALSAAWHGAVHEVFARQARSSPEALAVCDPAESWTYAELDLQANRLAQALIAGGVRPGDVVALHAHRSAPLVWGVLGALKAGAVFLMVDPAYPAARQCEMLRLAAPRGWLRATAAGEVPAAVAEQLAASCRVRLDLPPRAEALALYGPLPAGPPAVAVGPDDPACLGFTSGSTGEPKGIVGRHGSLSHFVPWQRERFGMGAADRFSMLSGLAHDPLQRDVFTPLQLGAALAIPDPERMGEPGWLAAWMRREGITVAHLTPAMTQLLTTEAGEAGAVVPSLRCALIVGDVLTRRDVARLRRLAPHVAAVNLYGSTETQRAVGYVVIEDVAAGLDELGGKEVLPLGRGMADVQLLVLGGAGGLAGIGEIGEIHVRSPHLALGYLGRPDLTAERFLVNPFTGEESDRLYRTGDLGRYLPGGDVAFAGRADTQVKIRGFRVELGEIEAALARHPAVAQAAVVLRRDGGEEPYLAAYVVPAPGAAPTASELRAFAEAELPSYMVPAAFVRLERLPLTPNRKLDRRALPVPERERLDGAAPRSPQEEMLVEVWSELLGRRRIGIHDDFFELGGHSLKATQLLSRLRDLFGVELPLRDLFEAPTVAGLAARLAGGQAEGPEVPPPPPLVPAPRLGPLPLSFGQERLWFVAQLEPDNPMLNLATALRLRGSLDRAALERSLAVIVRRHEALRARFHAVEGRPVQVFAPPADRHLPVVDLAALAPGLRAAEQRRRGLAEAWRPFSLATGPLLRALLARLGDREHVLFVTVHHIAADGWSLGVFFDELATLYGALAGGRQPRLPALPVQYGDYALWQRRWLQGEALAARLGYWRRQLAGELPVLELPTDRPRPAVRTFRGARRSLILSPALKAELQALSQRRNGTLFMTLLAGFLTLLHRYAGQEEIVVGTPIAHRDRAEIERLIGMFFNLLALRVDLAGDPAFDELLRRVREVTLGAYAHQDLPFEKLIEDLQPDRQLGRTPLFQVTFVLQNAPAPAVESTGLLLDPLELDRGTANFDLTLFLQEIEQGLWVASEHRVDLFDEATIVRLLEHFRRLLEGAVKDPGARLSDLPLESAAERHQLLVEWNDTAGPFPAGLALTDLFDAQVARAPEATAVVCGQTRLSYRELDRRAERLAALLAALGVGPNTLVAVYLTRSDRMITAVLGILKAGGAYVPLEPDYPAARVHHILDVLGIRQVVTERSLLSGIAGLAPLPALADLIALDELGELDEMDEAGRVPAGLPPHLTLWTPERFPCGTVTPARRGGPDGLAYIIFTSGSTGTPKGVIVRHRAVVNLIDWANRRFGLSPSDRVLFVTSLCFDLSVYDIFGLLAAGGSIHVASGEDVRDPERLVRLLCEEPITFWDSAPAALQQLAPAFPPPGSAAPPLRLVFLSGDWIPLGLPDQVRASFPGTEVISLGGATEATVWSNVFPVGAVEPHWLSIPYGVPIQNARYHVLDPALAPCPIGVPGDLYIGGECLSTGYAEAPELTAVKYVPDPFGGAGERLYRTGDRARYWTGGTLEFLGRRDQQVKIRGFRIELGEVEAALREHPGVRDAVAVVREDVPGNRRLVAYAVRDDRWDGAAAAAGGAGEQVSHWEMVYDEIYGRGGSDRDPTFDISGWISSYTGLPIPAEEMREWVEQTVARILALEPRRVLEVGCGTGLLLFRVAPHTRAYLGTDISATSLESIGRQLPSRGLSQVRLLKRAADDWSGIEPGSFDTVVINSVTQHFPSVVYLLAVLEGMVAAVADGGSVYVGDVRSLPHLAAFHASLQLHRGGAGLAREQLAALVRERTSQEEELVIDPALFLALPRHLPRVGNVEIHLQRGRHHNEVTRFRYSAVLRVGPLRADDREARSLDWRAAGLTPGGVRELLAREAPELLVLRGVPNARLTREAAALRWLAGEEPSATLDDLRERLEAEPAAGVDPEDLWALEEAGYGVRIAWSATDPVGGFDVVLERGGARRAVTDYDRTVRAALPSRPWRELANDPLLPALSGRLVGELREHLAGRLPEYMVPSAIVLLESLPLTSNGKLDRKALPAPDSARPQAEGSYVAPRTQVEEVVAEIWSEVLGAGRVGAEDNFFELGGHSLLATQVVSRLREVCAVELPLRALFEASTVAALAGMIEASRREAAPAPATIGRAPRNEPLPLSFAQQRLWFIAQMAPGSSLYHIPVAIHLQGTLDVAALERGLTAIVRRHEALRTTFREVEGIPFQVIHPEGGCAVRVVDLRALPAEDRRARADRLSFEEARRPFDLAAGPLLRALLLRLGDAEHVLLLTLHHAVADGWSVGVLFRELAALYEAGRAGRSSPLPELAVQYADFARWQREHLQGEVLAGQLTYWREQLAGAPPVLQLPLDRPRPAVQSFRGARQLFALPPAVKRGLEALGAQEKATLYMVLLAAFETLLYRYTGQDDVSVGSPIAGRTRAEVEPLIGFFVNTLVLRTRFADRPELRELVGRARETALGAYTHQDVPFEKLLEELQPDRDVSYPPLFQVMLTLQNAQLPRVELPDLQLALLTLDSRTANFDLSLLLVDGGESLPGTLTYNTDLFEPATAARMAGHLETLLAGIAADPGRPLWALPLLSPAERDQLLVEWNQPAVAYPAEGCVHRLFEEQARLRPEAPAVVLAGGELSYRELDRRANHLALRLERLGVGPEVLVGVYAERSPELVVGLLAVLKAGGAFVPFDPDYPAERLALLLASTPLRALLAQPRLVGRLPAVTAEVVPLDGLEESDERPASAVGPDHLAYVMYTSGSTGQPKGVMIPQRGFYNRIAFAWASGQALEGDRFLHKASASFDVSLLEIFIPLAGGGATVLARADGQRDPAYLVELMAEQRVTQAIFAPSLLRAVLEEEGIARCRGLRAVASSAEALPLDLQERFFALLEAELFNRYGPTETSIAVSSWRCVPGSGERTVPIGRPIAGARLYVLDRDLAPVPVGVAGELYVGGLCLGRGYLGRPEQTAERFLPDPFAGPGERLYRTGDLVRRRPDGALLFLGRADHQVKIRGVRIELGEVAAVLERHPGVREVAVVDDDGAAGKQLVAYVVPRPGASCAARELRAFVAARLPEPCVPAHFVSLASLPLLPSGKLDRQALPAPLEARTVETSLRSPATELERTIAGVWCEVLGLAQVGSEESFFELGGHSLLAVKVRARLEKLLGRAIPMVELFRNPTVGALARALGGVEAAPRTTERPVRALGGAPDVAIVGMAGRFPGAGDVETFWDNLRRGVETIRTFSDQELLAAGVAPERLADPRYVKAGGVLDGIELFDAGFFDIPPREAMAIDPQHRLFLECAWEALERAGYDPAAFGGRIGVFAGAGMNSYLLNLHSERELIETVGSFQALIGNDKDFLPTRTSYKLGLRGPSVAVQTACSTSLVAVHLACQSLRTGESDMALAGGVSISVPQEQGYRFQEGMILSPDGHCRAFDARAAGTVRGNGVGLVVLKRLDDALADGDHVHAVIRGSAINNDGAAKVGYTAPSVQGQAEVIAAAQALAGVDPSTIGYVEAHGTGTSLGDPIEIAALAQAFRAHAPGEGDGHRCAIGSVKTNVGHLNTAAGVSGLIKATLAVERGELPPSLHFERPNPEIDFGTGFYVNAELRPWPDQVGPRRAGVSSFGIGGTNAHVVLEQAPQPPRDPASRPAQLVLLSARSGEALAVAAANLAHWLERHPEVPLADAAFTLSAGRRRFAHRLALVCRDRQEAAAALRELDPARLAISVDRAADRPVAFLLPGQGSQHLGMALELWRGEPFFREELERVSALFAPHLGCDLPALLDPAAGDPAAAAARLEQTAAAQAALFAVEYALARLWLRWGVEPRALLGHSLGEYVAACLAGVFSLEDAVAVVAARGRLMQECPPGAMLAVPLPEGELADLLPAGVSVAAVNGPAASVVSGPGAEIRALEERLRGRGLECRRLHTSHAFHSALMEPAVAPFRAAVASVALRPPRIPFLSNVSGTWITAAEATDPGYWSRHLRQPVRFAAGLEALLAQPDLALLEVGPGRALSTLARRHPSRSASQPVVSSLTQAGEPGPELDALLGALGRLWLAGVKVDWQGFWQGEPRRRAPLPTYPFERRRYWVERQPLAPPAATSPRRREDLTAPASTPADDGNPPRAAGAPYAAPRPGAEQRIAALWRRLLGVEQVGRHDNFFELGGSSLSAVQLRARLAEAFGVDPSPHFLLERPTVAALAEWLEAAGTAPAEPELPACLVPLQRGAASRPLHLVHPAGGHVYFYRQMAALLDPGRPVYGLQAEGLEEGSRIEDMAAHYLAAVRRVQPEGPYLLGGSSMGGTIAFEMAQQLQARGERVALLALIDTPGRGQMPVRLGDDAAILSYLAGSSLPLEELRRLDADAQLAHVLAEARAAGPGFADLDLATARRLLGVFKEHMRALRGYRPRPYPGRITYFRAATRRPADPRHPERPWIGLAQGGIEIHHVPGHHISMHHSPNLEVLIERLRGCLHRLGE